MAREKRKPRKSRGINPIQNRILNVLAAASEMVDTVGDFTYHPYPYLYASLEMSYDRKNVDEATGYLAKKGLVERNEAGDVRLTPAGADIKKRLYRERRQRWDGKWRVVFFDIPESRRELRDDLRWELKKLGFGLWQRSAWVTPFGITRELESYLRDQNLSDLVQIVVGERFGDPNDREFAARVWPLSEINRRYKSFLAGWAAELKREQTDEDRFRAATLFHDRYIDILLEDPQLPAELLPRDWVGDKAADLFKKLKSLLSISRS